MSDFVSLKARLELDTAAINKALCSLVPDKDALLHRIHDSMNYSLLAGGKRVRPFLVIETFRAFDKSEAWAGKVLPLACAVEMIHTYSLIHDDLPSMDNDDYRRGRLTNHKVYGEACAILAGDALLTQAFGTAASAKLPANTLIKCISLISDAAGSCGMIGGQIIDLESERKKISEDNLLKMHRLKTGALIKLSVLLGYFSAGMTENSPAYEAVVKYSENIGLVFQIIDDVLDVTSNMEVLGKNVGSDAENGKTTFLSFHSVDEAVRIAKSLTDDAKCAIYEYDDPKEHVLSKFADYLYERKS